MTRKLLVTVLLLGIFVLSLTGSAFAWSGRADVEGRPDQFQTAGYYIWHNQRGFHIWTVAPEQGHIFSGVIRTDGQFVHVRGHNLEGRDAYSEGNNIPWFDARTISGNRFAYGGREVNCDNDKLRFRFNTIGGSDGLNFDVRNASYIEFDLYMDGKPIQRRLINLGDECWHPRDNRFRIFP